jgi:hypothetical protein
MHAAAIQRTIVGCDLLMAPELVFPAAQPHVPLADSERLQGHLTELAHFGADPEDGGVSRVGVNVLMRAVLAIDAGKVPPTPAQSHQPLSGALLGGIIYADSSTQFRPQDRRS